MLKTRPDSFMPPEVNPRPAVLKVTLLVSETHFVVFLHICGLPGLLAEPGP